MHTYDISVSISPDLPIWPGDTPLSVERVEKIEDGDGANITQIKMSAHSGTHIDAPYHFLADGARVDEIPLEVLTGRAYVLDLSEVDLVTASVVEGANIPPRTRRVLFKTRNSTFWSRNRSDFQEDYVALDAGAANFLVDRGVKVVGVDYLSVAPYRATRPTHEILLKAGVVIVEGLDLSEVSQGRYTFYCLPLKLAGADGAPARVILVGV